MHLMTSRDINQVSLTCVKVEINGFTPEQAYSFETTSPRGSISDLWTLEVNTTLHTQNKVTVSLFVDFVDQI